MRAGRPMSVITDEARAWAQQEFPTYTVTVSRVDIERFSMAIGERDSIHTDVDAAIAAGYPGLVAPPYFPYTIRQQASTLGPKDALAVDGSPSAEVPPLPTTRAMAGETSIELGVPIVAGDTITVEKRIADMYEKEGRSGPLVFLVTEFVFTNQHHEMVMRETFTRIFR